MADRNESTDHHGQTGGAPLASDNGKNAGQGVSREKKSRKKGASGPEQPKEPAAGGAKAGAAPQDDKDKKTQKSHKKPKQKRAGLVAACIAGTVLAGGAVYALMAQRYKEAFFPNTQINGLDASGKTMEEVKNMIASEIEGYTLTIETRDGQTEQITGAQIGLTPEFDGSLEEVLTTQNPYAWLDYQLNPASYFIDTMIIYDEEALEKRIEQLSCMDPAQMREAVDAKISDYIPGEGYTVVPEEGGTEIVEAVFREKVKEAIQNLNGKLSLAEAGVYKEAEIRQDNPELLERAEALNRYARVTITYQFGSQTETLDGDRIHEWITADEEGKLALNAELAAAYVAELASAYNTSNKAKTIKTSYGPEITVKGGTYGWRIDEAEETAQLIAAIEAGESQTREPVYSQKGASRDGNDYGNTYVEINLTGQHLYMYKEGKLVVESDFVSGNLSRGWGTPAGTYPLTYKQRNAVLKGENYRTPVDYWMPFNGGIGMHDAKWRGTFGGSIYRTNGSHGCINLPHSVAKTIYENIEAGMPVICYNLEGTEKKSTSYAPSSAAPAAAPAQPAVVPTEAPALPEETAPTEAPQPAGPAGPSSDIETQPPETPPAPAEAPAPETAAPAEPPAAPPDAGEAAQPGEERGGPAGPGSDTGNGGDSGPGGV